MTHTKADSVVLTEDTNPVLVKAAIAVIQAIAEVIREKKRIPDGHLYALVLDKISLNSYTEIIGVLVGSGVVARDGDELVWKGKW